ncbi:hypothetical protein M9458_002739, partial [Cirrhinus mrigala]
KKYKVKPSKGPETPSAPSLAVGIPQITVGPLGLETGPRPDGRDVMSDGSSEGSSQADETPRYRLPKAGHGADPSISAAPDAHNITVSLRGAAARRRGRDPRSTASDSRTEL